MFQRFLDLWSDILDWIFDRLPGEEFREVVNDKDAFVIDFDLPLEDGDYHIHANATPISMSRRWWWPFFIESMCYELVINPAIPLGKDEDGFDLQTSVLEIMADTEEEMVAVLEFVVFTARGQYNFTMEQKPETEPEAS